ncbi:MAG: hypothetical protein MN733_38685 [Nitrososphaera sp.]|nr:hypothetical protein [Nitrososphaera sp.]
MTLALSTFVVLSFSLLLRQFNILAAVSTIFQVMNDSLTCIRDKNLTDEQKEKAAKAFLQKLLRALVNVLGVFFLSAFIASLPLIIIHMLKLPYAQHVIDYFQTWDGIVMSLLLTLVIFYPRRKG